MLCNFIICEKLTFFGAVFIQYILRNNSSSLTLELCGLPGQLELNEYKLHVEKLICINKYACKTQGPFFLL